MLGSEPFNKQQYLELVTLCSQYILFFMITFYLLQMVLVFHLRKRYKVSF